MKEAVCANLTRDSYFMDGLRLVVFFSTEARSLKQVDGLPWERPAGQAAEGPQSEDSLRQRCGGCFGSCPAIFDDH
jgi:hypothetical protein